MHQQEKAVNDYVREELRHEVKVFLDAHEKRHLKWYLLFTFVLLVILGVMSYIGITFNKWNTIWEAKAQKDKEAMEQYLKDRNDWITDSLEVKNGTREKR